MCHVYFDTDTESFILHREKNKIDVCSEDKVFAVKGERATEISCRCLALSQNVRRIMTLQ